MNEVTVYKDGFVVSKPWNLKVSNSETKKTVVFGPYKTKKQAEQSAAMFRNSK